jgi:fused signal recognition particle receptor
MLVYILVAVAIVAVAVASLLVRGRRRQPGAAQTSATVAEAAPAASEPAAGIAEVEAPPLAEPPAETPSGLAPPAEAPPVTVQTRAPVEEVPSLRERLGRARYSFGQALAGVFRRDALAQQDWEEAEAILLRADVGVAATTRIIQELKSQRGPSMITMLRERLVGILEAGDRTLRRKPAGLTIWLVTGVNGTGKTTTIGKLAFAEGAQGRRVVLAAADTFRAAADEQLELWAERSRADVVKHAAGADPAAVAFDGVRAAVARNADLLIVDTAGRLHTKRNLMEELAKLRRVIEREAGPPDEVLLVLDATTGQNGIAQARAFAESAGVSGIVLTKLDGTAKGGIVIAVQEELGVPVKLIGVGEGAADLAPFDPAAFVEALIE